MPAECGHRDHLGLLVARMPDANPQIRGPKIVSETINDAQNCSPNVPWHDRDLMAGFEALYDGAGMLQWTLGRVVA